MNYHRLYQEGSEPDKMDQYPKGDDSVGKPKKDKQNKKAPFKAKIKDGGTSKTKEATTTSGPDDRMNVSDSNKVHPGY